MRNMGSSTLWLWVMMILVLGMKGWCCFGGCLEQERIALLQLKANINYPNGTSLPSWAEEEITNCCQWEEVVCNNTTNRVTQLSLNYTRPWIVGDWYFNASLFLPFEELTALYLPANGLVGWVENEGFERLSRLRNLEVLDLSRNRFNNSVLSSFSGLSSLKYLSLQLNQLGGSTHFNSFGRLTGLTNLEVLDLSYNQLNKNIYSFLKLDDFSSLKELDLSHNEIKSFEPVQGLDRESILSNLEVLDLSYNNFNNNIWSSLSRFPSLKTLYLIENKLNGTFHSQDLENLSSMENLFLDGATLDSGFLPSIRVMTSLQVLSLQECGLTGSLPTQGLCELKTLRELDLKGNGLWGNLPWCMANLTSLRLLDISDNHFTGNIALSPLVNLTSLEYLALSNNGFQIPISFRSFCNHSRLKFLESLNNNLLEEEDKFQASCPSFQLNDIRLSNSEHGNLSRAFLPQFLYHQHDLRKVELSRIDFSGKFPSWLLENNTGMVTLFLRNNSLCGPLSLPLPPATELLALEISNNNLQGRIPHKIASIFPSLKSLNMSTNGFEGGIPSSLGDMTSLIGLDLSNNRLSGEIPMRLAVGCPSLHYLILSNNNLKGSILPTHPQNNLTELFHLYVDRNQFTEIPHSLSRSSHLGFLNVSQNQLSGRIPGWMGINMSSLLVLVMSNNHLEGPIPTEFCQLNQLWLLDISENNITGTIPSCFKPPYIEQVQLSKNRLHGPFPKAFRNSSTLSMLDLSHNHFTNNIPDWIDSLSSLTILLLKNNSFEGNIPKQICHLSGLTLIDLSFNNFSGSIPHCLNNITFNEVPHKTFLFEAYIDFSFLQYDMNMASKSEKSPSTYLITIFGPPTETKFTTKGTSFSYKGVVLDLFSGIDLSHNKLSGHIPLEIGNLSLIKVLNLSHNNLTGIIPATFSNLKNIESLDLSYNNLNGKIPSQLTGLYSLEVFNVSYNNLSGRTPQRIAQFGTFDWNSYVGNPLLCGEPLPNCSAIDSTPSMPRAINGSKVDYGFIDMDSFYMSFAGSYITMLLGIAAILFINPHWRRVWFHLVEVFITSCYYFAVDNFQRLRGGSLRK